jgi:GT2 family glycosyltransferase
VDEFRIEADAFGAGIVVRLAGWAFDAGARDPVLLQLRCDGTVLYELKCSNVRRDIAAAAPDLVESSSLPLCGFEDKYYLEEERGLFSLYSPAHERVLIEGHFSELGGAETTRQAPPGKRRFPWRPFFMQVARRGIAALSSGNVLSAARWRHWLGRMRSEYRRHRSQSGAELHPAGPTHRLVYARYVENNRIRPHVRRVLEQAVETLTKRPTFSIIMPVFNVDPRWLRAAVESVKNQIYPFWELCIADDSSTRAATLEYLRGLENDDRIKITYRSENGHISRASNSAAALASGQFFLFMDNDDALAPHAVFEMARALQEHPDADLLYSDEDKIDEAGNRYDGQFKPDWSPALFLGYNYVNHLTCIRRSLFDELGGFRTGFEGAQDYDLLLRAIEKTHRIQHIPKVLYHWRALPESTASDAQVKPIVEDAARRGLQDYLRRNGVPAQTYTPRVAKRERVPISQLDWPDSGPDVTIIIPTYNQHKVLERCIESILEATTYQNYEILIVDNGSDNAKTIEYLRALDHPKVRVERIPNDAGGFSFSRLNNLAVESSDAGFVCFLNDDTEVLEPRWLSRLVGYAQLPGVGATGARLIYPSRTVQHAGVLLHARDALAPGHAFAGHPATRTSYYFLAETARETSAVTAACMLTSRETFKELGGFCEDPFRVSLNDVDYCLRLAERGLRCVYVAGAELKHYESLSRDVEDDPAELAAFKRMYRHLPDRYYNRNLSPQGDFSFVPRCTLDYDAYREHPLQVACFTHNLNFEGGPKVIMDAARGISSRSGIRCEMVSFQDGPRRESLMADGIPCRILRLPGTDNVLRGWSRQEDFDAAVGMVKAYFREANPDVVVAMTLNNFFVVEAAADCGIPSIWLIQESYDEATMFQNVFPLGVARCEEAFSKAHKVVFGSNDTATLYRRYNARLNFTVIHNGLRCEKIDQARRELGKDEARARIGAPANQKVILGVGTICSRKYQETLVKALARLAREGWQFRAYLVGARETESYIHKVRRLIAANGLEQMVELVPETDEVFAYYRAADVFAFTSLIESYSYVILEAMAFDLPLVTTPACGVGEQVRFGVNALEVPFGDDEAMAAQLAKLLADDGLRRRMGSNSRNVFEYLLNYEEMADRYAELVRSAWHVGIE